MALNLSRCGRSVPRDDQEINIALFGGIAAGITSEKNDLLGIETIDDAVKHLLSSVEAIIGLP